MAKSKKECHRVKIRSFMACRCGNQFAPAHRCKMTKTASKKKSKSKSAKAAKASSTASRRCLPNTIQWDKSMSRCRCETKTGGRPVIKTASCSRKGLVPASVAKKKAGSKKPATAAKAPSKKPASIKRPVSGRTRRGAGKLRAAIKAGKSTSKCIPGTIKFNRKTNRCVCTTATGAKPFLPGSACSRESRAADKAFSKRSK